MIAGVGMAFGSTEQGERLIAAVNGVAAAIRDKKQDEVQDTMEDLLEELRRRQLGWQRAACHDPSTGHCRTDRSVGLLNC